DLLRERRHAAAADALAGPHPRLICRALSPARARQELPSVRLKPLAVLGSMTTCVSSSLRSAPPAIPCSSRRTATSGTRGRAPARRGGATRRTYSAAGI